MHPSNSQERLLIWEIVSAALFRLLIAPIRLLNRGGASTLFEDVFITIFRTVMQHSDLAVLRAIFKPTTDVYHDFCRDTRREPKSINSDRIKARWIGDDGADVVVLYFYGRIALEFTPYLY